MIESHQIRPQTIVKVFGVVIIPATAGALLLFLDPLMVLLVTVALYLSLWLLFKPFPALVLYTILVAVRPQEGVAQLEAMHVERLFALLALLGWGLQAAVERKSVSLPRGVTLWFLAFVVVSFGSIFTSVWKLAAVDAWLELLKAGVLFFLVSQVVNTPRRLFIFLLVFSLGHVWMAAESLRLYYSEGYDYVRMGIVRATTSSVSRGDPNTLAASLLLAVCFAIFTLRSRASFLWRASWLGVILTGGVVVVLTGSRAAMVAALFMLAYVWLKSRAKPLVAALLVIVVVGGWFLMPAQYQERFLTTFDFERNPSAAESARGRIAGLTVGLKMFLDRPFLGVGIGNFSVANATVYSPPGEESWLQAHNLLAQVAGETGLLGTIAFAGFVIASMRLAGRLTSRRRVSSHSRFPRHGTLQPDGAPYHVSPETGSKEPAATARLASGPERPAAASSRSQDIAFVRSVCAASLAVFWLLLVLGLFGHNMMRFSWYLTAGMLAACASMLAAIEDKRH